MSSQLQGVDHKEVEERMWRWANAHPFREGALFFTLDGQGISPLDLAAHVSHNSRIGIEHVAAMAQMAELQKISLLDILDRMVRSVEEPHHLAMH